MAHIKKKVFRYTIIKKLINLLVRLQKMLFEDKKLVKIHIVCQNIPVDEDEESKYSHMSE